MPKQNHACKVRSLPSGCGLGASGHRLLPGMLRSARYQKVFVQLAVTLVMPAVVRVVAD